MYERTRTHRCVSISVWRLTSCDQHRRDVCARVFGNMLNTHMHLYVLKVNVSKEWRISTRKLSASFALSSVARSFYLKACTQKLVITLLLLCKVGAFTKS